MKQQSKKADKAEEASKNAVQSAEESKRMMSTIFTTIGIADGDQVVEAVKTKEGAVVKVENAEYESHFAFIDQETGVMKEDVEDLRSEVEALRAQMSKLSRQKR